MKRTLRMMLVPGLLLVLAGCPAGCRTMQKAAGTRDVMLSAAPDKVVEAVKGAFTELKIQHVSSSATKLDGEVVGKSGTDKDITVKVKSEGEKVSRMTVKVGTMGDKVISDSIIAETKKRI